MPLELRGAPVANKMATQIKSGVHRWQEDGYQPKMVTILLDGDPASEAYAKAKQRIAKKLGVAFEVHRFSEDVTEAHLVKHIRDLNDDVNVHGVMVELPLPAGLSADHIVGNIAWFKDVDGLTHANRMANINGSTGLYPATPEACVELVKHYGYSLKGAHVVLVGCGKTVGQPLMHLLLREKATLTVCHDATEDLRSHLRQADIAFVAVGQAGLITTDMVHPDLVIVDAGINETADQTIVGDVDPKVSQYVKAMSPTPGGVGTVTTMQIFANLLKAMHFQFETDTKRTLHRFEGHAAQGTVVSWNREAALMN